MFKAQIVMSLVDLFYWATALENKNVVFFPLEYHGRPRGCYQKTFQIVELNSSAFNQNRPFHPYLESTSWWLDENQHIEERERAADSALSISSPTIILTGDDWKPPQVYTLTPNLSGQWFDLCWSGNYDLVKQPSMDRSTFFAIFFATIDRHNPFSIFIFLPAG